MASHILSKLPFDRIGSAASWDALNLTKGRKWRYCSIGLFWTVAKTQICSGFTVFLEPRFMESLHSILRMHWDHEPVGARSAAVCGGRGTSRSTPESIGALWMWFIESLNDSPIAHRSNEPRRQDACATSGHFFTVPVPPKPAMTASSTFSPLRCARAREVSRKYGAGALLRCHN
jgi:hypothetical protein